jgi:hypothetical protein
LTTKEIRKDNIKDKFPITKFPITKSTIENATFWSIFLEATEKTQQPFLKRAIKDKFIEEKLNDADFIAHIQNLIIQSTSVSGSNIDKAIPIEFLYELANFLSDENIKIALSIYSPLKSIIINLALFLNFSLPLYSLNN